MDVIIDKKIIEFNGDFWHANPNIYKKFDSIAGVGCPSKIAFEIWEADENRMDNLKRMGYSVMVVWEYDWLNNRERIIEEIKKYLYDNTETTGN